MRRRCRAAVLLVSRCGVGETRGAAATSRRQDARFWATGDVGYTSLPAKSRDFVVQRQDLDFCGLEVLDEQPNRPNSRTVIKYISGHTPTMNMTQRFGRQSSRSLIQHRIWHA